MTLVVIAVTLLSALGAMLLARSPQLPCAGKRCKLDGLTTEPTWQCRYCRYARRKR